jgi:hypothetical protein
VRVVLCCLLIFTLTGCAGVGDYDIDLGKGFKIIRISNDVIRISQEEVESVYRDFIPEKVTEANYDERFIIAKQLGFKNDLSEKLVKKIPDESNISYWIIDKSNLQVFGPLSLDSFNEKKKELEMELNLIKIEDLNKYK